MKVANRLDTHRHYAVGSVSATSLQELIDADAPLNKHTDSLTIQVDGGSVRMTANTASAPTGNVGVLLADGDVLEHVSLQETGWLQFLAVAGTPVLQVIPCREVS